MERTGKVEAPNLGRVLKFLYHQDVACFWLIPSGLWVQPPSHPRWSVLHQVLDQSKQ